MNVSFNNSTWSARWYGGSPRGIPRTDMHVGKVSKCADKARPPLSEGHTAIVAKLLAHAVKRVCHNLLPTEQHRAVHLLSSFSTAQFLWMSAPPPPPPVSYKHCCTNTAPAAVTASSRRNVPTFLAPVTFGRARSSPKRSVGGVDREGSRHAFSRNCLTPPPFLFRLLSITSS